MCQIDNTNAKYMHTKEQLNKLTEKERMYYNMMLPKYGVLYITSKPGLAKSAIARSIAEKLGMNYFDIRLSMVDETDVGLYPTVSEVDVSGKATKVLEFVVPEWAIRANEAPCIIHFEELNRASLQVRNAALQLLLERCIGTKFRFNDNVLMLASGNLGEEDGTDVEEFDSALNNRLIHVKHDLTAHEWIDTYAKDKVHPLIVNYIKNYPEEFYKRGKEDVRSYATPRSWTFLSSFINSTLGENENTIENVRDLVRSTGFSYIGNSQVKFCKYLEETMRLSINDVLKSFNKVKDALEKSNRDKRSELLNNLREMKLTNLTETETANLISFLNILDEDEIIGYLTYIIDSEMDEDLKKWPYKNILQSYNVMLKKISSLSDPKNSK
jgi:hypothetical protein